jgi:hypothetical protein
LVSGGLQAEPISDHPALSASSTQQPAKTVAQTYVDPPPWPQTLHEIWATSPLVVLGVVASTDPPHVLGDHGLVGRNHTVGIIEVLKSTFVNPPGSPVVVRQLGGTVLTNNGTELSTTLPDVILREGQEYVLFLGRSNETGVFVIRYDAAAFLVGPTARLVSMPTAATRLAELKGKSEFAVQDFLALVRAFRDKP